MFSVGICVMFSLQDCLDRTNVVQSAFAKFVLTQQLKDIGVLSDKESIDDHEDFMNVFRNRKLCMNPRMRVSGFYVSDATVSVGRPRGLYFQSIQWHWRTENRLYSDRCPYQTRFVDGRTELCGPIPQEQLF
jgi:hypothetical protein